MKKYLLFIPLILLIAACERVAPNYVGVLMENFGKEGKSDYSIVQGKVSTWAIGTELFQVPLWEQRSGFEKEIHLQASDKTAFTCLPSYSYFINKDRAVDVVFHNSHLGSGSDFLTNLQDNVLEARIYDVLKDLSRSYNTEYLMADGGSLKYEKEAERTIRMQFDSIGIRLETFTAQLNFSEKVTTKIDDRNEVDQDIATLDKAILKQKKQNELAKLQAEENLIKSSGLTPALLQHELIAKWNGATLIDLDRLTFIKQVQ
jgi:hypothetical protein